MFHIDFHVHTAERSHCATASQTEQIQAAIKSGLHAIAITDHFQLVPISELRWLNRNYAPFRILNGIEITANSEDWLVLGLTDKVLETEKWTYPHLHQYVTSRGGILILAYPFRYHTTIGVDIFKYSPDGIELRTNNIRLELVPQIKDLAEQLHIPTLCNSDAHTTSTIGRYYNIFDQSNLETENIFRSLRSGMMRPSVT